MNDEGEKTKCLGLFEETVLEDSSFVFDTANTSLESFC